MAQTLRHRDLRSRDLNLIKLSGGGGETEKSIMEIRQAQIGKEEKKEH